MTGLPNQFKHKGSLLLRCVGPSSPRIYPTKLFRARRQENYDGYGAHLPAADPPEAFPGVRLYPAPPVDNPPAVDGLRNLARHFLNNPGTLVNMLRIVPGPGGRFEVWIALELADIYIF